MNKELYIGIVTLVLAFALIYVPIGYAQNLTTNTSNAARNMTVSANQTASELGQNASLAVNRTGESLQEFGKNTSLAVNRTGESLQEFGKNATEVGGEILNKTGEVGKKIIGGAADVVGNISEEVKEGVEK